MDIYVNRTALKIHWIYKNKNIQIIKKIVWEVLILINWDAFLHDWFRVFYIFRWMHYGMSCPSRRATVPTACIIPTTSHTFHRYCILLVAESEESWEVLGMIIPTNKTFLVISLTQLLEYLTTCIYRTDYNLFHVIFFCTSFMFINKALFNPNLVGIKSAVIKKDTY